MQVAAIEFSIASARAAIRVFIGVAREMATLLPQR
jgi:hypothetical protein